MSQLWCWYMAEQGQEAKWPILVLNCSVCIWQCGTTLQQRVCHFKDGSPQSSQLGIAFIVGPHKDSNTQWKIFSFGLLYELCHELLSGAMERGDSSSAPGSLYLCDPGKVCSNGGTEWVWELDWVLLNSLFNQHSVFAARSDAIHCS